MTVVEELMNRDRIFCANSQTNKTAAWKDVMLPTTIMGTGGTHPYIVGWDAIAPGLEQMYQLDSLVFHWEPVHAFVSEDATLGVTTGTYVREFLQNKELNKRQGKYMTVWKKVDQTWYAVFDMGN